MTMTPELSKRLADVINSATFVEKGRAAYFALVDEIIASTPKTFEDLPVKVQTQILAIEAEEHDRGTLSPAMQEFYETTSFSREIDFRDLPQAPDPDA